MKTLFRFGASLILALLVVLPLSIGAQTYLTSTTLSAAVTTTTGNNIPLTAVTGITANTTSIYVDRELMRVTAVNGTTSVSVIRGFGSTNGQYHRNAATVIIGPNQVFVSSDVDGSTGRAPGSYCTASDYQYLPVVNVINGNVWLCRPIAAGQHAVWAGTNNGLLTYNSLLLSLS